MSAVERLRQATTRKARHRAAAALKEARALWRTETPTGEEHLIDQAKDELQQAIVRWSAFFGGALPAPPAAA